MKGKKEKLRGKNKQGGKKDSRMVVFSRRLLEMNVKMLYAERGFAAEEFIDFTRECKAMHENKNSSAG